MNWGERIKAEQRARSAWVRTDQANRTNWVKEDEASRTRWIATSEAIRANRELSYKGREDRLTIAYRVYQDEKDQNWTNYQNRKDQAWRAFQDRLAQIGAEFARSEQADKDAHNRAKQDNHDRRDAKGRFTTSPTNRAFWDNGDRSRATYLKLAKLYHPDNGGDTKTMQDINAAFGR